MSIVNGVKRLTLVAYLLTAVGTLAAMGVYSRAPTVSVNGWVFLVTAAAFLLPFFPFGAIGENKEGVALGDALRWADHPFEAFFLSAVYAVSAVIVATWSIVHVAPDADYLLLVLLAALPFLGVLAVLAVLAVVLVIFKFVADGFRQTR